MKSPRLSHYFHLPILLLMLGFVLSVAWVVWVGLGTWNLNRTIGVVGDNPWALVFIKLGLTLLPTLMASIYFLRCFFRKQKVHLFLSLLIATGAVLNSLAIMPLLN